MDNVTTSVDEVAHLGIRFFIPIVQVDVAALEEIDPKCIIDDVAIDNSAAT